jgi:hypothetical protein
MMEDYPRRYQQQREAGNVLVFCSRSGGWGNFVQALPAAVLLSLLLDQAFVMECDVEVRDIDDPRKLVTLHSRLSRYFVGPHFDWSGRTEIVASANPNVVSAVHDWGAIKVRPQASGMHPTRAFIKGGHKRLQAEALARLNQALATERLGASLARHPNLGGCLLRYILAPSSTLAHLLATGVSNRPLAIAPLGQLHASIAAHIRLGDASLSSVNLSDWRLAQGSYMSQRSAFDVSPLGSVRCLVSTGLSSLAPGVCAGCFVASDSPQVEQVVARLVDDPIRTRGTAVHLLASSAAECVHKESPTSRASLCPKAHELHGARDAPQPCTATAPCLTFHALWTPNNSTPCALTMY